MTEKQLEALGPALDDFPRPYLFCGGYTQSFAPLHTYCKGLLADVKRKTVEPSALASGWAVRTSQEFRRDHLWDFAPVRQPWQSHGAALLPTWPADDRGTVGLLDETSAVKSADKTPGVQRQYLGGVGKIANGIVPVHRGACTGRSKARCDAELYLSQEWAADTGRRTQAGLPADRVYRPEGKIALEEVDRARTRKVPFDWLTLDEE
jgi:SRSO17 transposase